MQVGKRRSIVAGISLGSGVRPTAARISSNVARKLVSEQPALPISSTRGERQLPPAAFRILARGVKESVKRTRPYFDVPPFPMCERLFRIQKNRDIWGRA